MHWLLHLLYQTLLDSTGILAIGTDYPVVSINPFENIYAAVTRCFFDGSQASHNPTECLTVGETLLGYTKWAAKAYGRDNELGTLKKGMLADLVILDRNLFKVSNSDILGTNVELTMLGGKIIYTRE